MSPAGQNQIIHLRTTPFTRRHALSPVTDYLSSYLFSYLFFIFFFFLFRSFVRSFAISCVAVVHVVATTCLRFKGFTAILSFFSFFHMMDHTLHCTAHVQFCTHTPSTLYSNEQRCKRRRRSRNALCLIFSRQFASFSSSFFISSISHHSSAVGDVNLHFPRPVACLHHHPI